MLKTGKVKERLVLLDAHAIIHRAYHALPDFATSRGEPTGALYGLTLMVLKIASELKPDFLIACFDLPKPTYRHEVYEGYKAGRQKTDDDLAIQLEKSKSICEALNIPIYSKEGFEADDMLGTIVERLKNEDLEIIIASGDMDTLQLVDGQVKVYTLKKGIKDTILYDEKAVKERFGFEPRLLPDYKGLRGDPSDNIIGIPGIGEKSATELITNFGSLENIYKKLKAKNSELQEKIKPRTLELLKEGEEEAKFSKMLATIRRDASIDFELPKKRWSDGLDLKRAEEIFTAFEFRTMGQKLREALNKNGTATVEKQKQTEDINPTELEETLLALWVVDSNITNPKIEDLFRFAQTEDFRVARDKVFLELKKRESESVFAEIEKPLIPILKETERYGILVDKVFLGKLKEEYSKELKEVEEKIWQLAGATKFNIASPKQLSEILFDKLGLQVKNHKKTGSGAKSTRESELEKMKGMHPIVPLVLEYREISKLLSTYIEPIPKALDQNSRLHSHFVQAGAATGRMSSENPNLQNIPIGSERGRRIRHAFLASTGHQLLALDYSQIELRIAAILSREDSLIDIFKSGKDVHTAVAAEVFGVSLESVTKEMRRQAKVINFGILYGMGVNALQVNLGTDRKTAQQFLNAYFANFPKLSEYLDQSKLRAERDGYTKTIFGRRRYFEGIKSKIPYIKAAAERMAINAPIQGTNADIVKIAMKRIDEMLQQEGWSKEVHLLMQIHDELVYEVNDRLIDPFSRVAKEIMEQVLTKEQTLGVPIVVNHSVGPNWGEMK